MSKYDDVKIKYWVSWNGGLPSYYFKIYTHLKEYNKISGHRFVNLVDYKNPYQNDAEMILQFIQRMPFIENDYMKCGKVLEQPVINEATRVFGLENVKSNFGFEDLKNGTENFYFMRDLMFELEGKEYVGEVKTFYNKKKINFSKENPFPEPHISWWLQTRLEVEILKKAGRIFYYYVDPTTKKAIIKGRNFTVRQKYLFMSDDIEQSSGKEEVIVNYFDELSISTFKELMQYAKDRREDITTLYEDEEGTFYFAEVHVKELFYNGKDHVLRFLEDIGDKIKIEEIEHGRKRH